MDSYTGRDYVEAAFTRERLDRVPAAALCSFAQVWPRLHLTGRQLRAEPDKLVAALTANAEAIPSDASAFIVGDEMLTAEALGTKAGITGEQLVDWGRQGLRLLRDKSLFAEFELPDLRKGARMPYYLEVCRLALSQLEAIAIWPFTPSPWSTAMGWRGIEDFIFDTRDDPDFVQDLLAFTTAYTKVVGEAILSTGVGYIVIAEPSASCSVISPKLFRQYVKPYLKEAVDYLRGLQEGRVLLHMCGYADPVMQDLVEIGFDGMSIDSPSSLQRMVETNENRSVLIGNAPTEVFLSGTKEEIGDAAKEGIDTAAAGNGYILCSGCQVPDLAPIENTIHFLRAAHTYSRRN
jgi:uroporphyrinogen decarboxylase